MKKILYILIPVLLVALLIVKLKTNKQTSVERVFQYNKEDTIPVETKAIQLGSISTQKEYSGIFEADKETKVSAEIQGKVNELLVDVGAYVVNGQTLLLLDNELLKLQVQSTELQVEGLEADVRRYSVLAKADAINGMQLEKAELALRSAKVQRELLLAQISKTSIKAPFNGFVTAKLTELGAFAAPGVPLFQITDISKLKFTIQVSENDLSNFEMAQIVSVSADAYPDLMLNAKTILIGSKANMGSSFPVQFEVNNTKNHSIKSGMFGKLKLSEGGQSKGLIIPASVIIGSGEDTQVYKVVNGKAVLHSVHISQKLNDQVLISEGLKAGDKIVVSGFINLFNGANTKSN